MPQNTLMTSQRWFGWTIDAARQQAIPSASVDPDLCCHMALLGQNEILGKTMMSGVYLVLTHLTKINGEPVFP